MGQAGGLGDRYFRYQTSFYSSSCRYQADSIGYYASVGVCLK